MHIITRQNLYKGNQGSFKRRENEVKMRLHKCTKSRKCRKSQKSTDSTNTFTSTNRQTSATHQHKSQIFFLKHYPGLCLYDSMRAWWLLEVRVQGSSQLVDWVQKHYVCTLVCHTFPVSQFLALVSSF